MDAAWQEKIRERAYAIWLRQGSPDGRPEQFWLMAEEELLAEGKGLTAGHANRPGDHAPEQAARDKPGRR